MQVSATILLGALAAFANAIQLTDSSYDIVAGQPFDITWTGASGDVTITLKNGNSGDLKTVQTITTSGTGGSFTWTPSSSLPSDTYALEVSDASGNTNYSPQFSFVGSGTPSVTTSTASSTTSGSTSSSTSASTTSVSSTITSLANSTATHTPISNSTTLTTTTSKSSSSASSTGSSASSSASATTTKTPNTSNGHRVASSLALILGAAVAFVAFN